MQKNVFFVVASLIISLSLFLSYYPKLASGQFMYGGETSFFEAHGTEALTVNVGTVTSFDSTKYNSTKNELTNRAILYTGTTSVRAKWNGDNPTATEGCLIGTNTVFQVIGHQNIKNFKAIAPYATVTIQVIYEKIKKLTK